MACVGGSAIFFSDPYPTFPLVSDPYPDPYLVSDPTRIFTNILKINFSLYSRLGVLDCML